MKTFTSFLSALLIVSLATAQHRDVDSLTNINADFMHTVNGMTAEFTDMSTSDSMIENYFWDFGDTNFLDTNISGPISHTYDTNGMYDVFLSVWDGTCSDEVTKTVSIGFTSVEINTGKITELSTSIFPNPSVSSCISPVCWP